MPNYGDIAYWTARRFQLKLAEWEHRLRPREAEHVICRLSTSDGGTYALKILQERAAADEALATVGPGLRLEELALAAKVPVIAPLSDPEPERPMFVHPIVTGTNESFRFILGIGVPFFIEVITTWVWRVRSGGSSGCCTRLRKPNPATRHPTHRRIFATTGRHCAFEKRLTSSGTPGPDTAMTCSWR